MIADVLQLSAFGINCHTSSVICGIIGCNILKDISRTYLKTLCVFVFKFSSLNWILAISTYQSQYEFQKKSYNTCAVSPILKFSILLLTSFAVEFNLSKIHLSAIVKLLKSISLPSTPSKFINTNLDAFQILLAKFLPYSNLSSLTLISCPP